MTTALDPRRVADVVLSVALHAAADVVYVEPNATGDGYVVSLERGAEQLTSEHLDQTVGAALIARLGFLAELDLSAGQAATGMMPLRAGEISAEAFVTIRFGALLRAQVTIMARASASSSRPSVFGLSPGDLVGHWRVGKRLGEGGMGTVYEVEHTTLQRSAALKVLRANVIARDPGAAPRFVREARAAARIRHPNIVDVFDFGYLGDGRPYFVMELLSGQSLGDLIDLGPIEPSRAILIGRQLAMALDAAHDHGVIHADVTPSNALVDASTGTRVKLVDFGLAELISERVDDGIASVVLGTPAYISPEQIRGLPPTEKSDQYSLGAVIFEMVAGVPPFNARDVRELCMQHLEGVVPELTSSHGPLPAGLSELVSTCLQKSPASRFPSMRALLAALEQVGDVAGRQGWQRWLRR